MKASTTGQIFVRDLRSSRNKGPTGRGGGRFLGLEDRKYHHQERELGEGEEEVVETWLEPRSHPRITQYDIDPMTKK